ncbi:hypothetical protein ABFX02_02G031200 [Erythranthe guttata]
METEVMAPSSSTSAPPSAAAEFNFDSTCTTPYISASSSPQRFPTTFYSLPVSPTRISAFYHQFHDGAAAAADDSMSSIPFHWEEKPGTPKSTAAISSTASSNYGDADQELNDADFAFDFSGHFSSLPADELFDGGRIKPLKPPPKFLYDQNRPLDSPKSPKSPKNFIIEAFSPRRNRPADDFDPFAAAIDQTRKEKLHENNKTDKRGREHSRTTNNNKGSRSVSPLRVSDLLFDNDDDDDEHEQQQQPTKTNPPLLSSFSSFWYKKWRIKDLLLFRSASESRAKDEDELKKYTMLRKPPPPPPPPAAAAEAAPPPQEEVKNSSFRSTESVGSVSSRRRTSGPAISAHELHYTVNRALSEEMRKRTTLPYKRGFLGCLGFHPTVSEMSKGIAPMSNGSLSRG